MTMSTQMDIDALMMDALDGTLGPDGQAALRAYFERHPDEEVAFSRMLKADAAFQSIPVETPPVYFTNRVMGAVKAAQFAPATRPSFSAQQIVFVALLFCVLAIAGWLLILGVLSLIDPAAAAQGLQALAAFGTNVLRIARDILQLIYVFVRAVLSQPVVWLVGLGLGAIVLVWVRVVAGILASGLRPVPAVS